MLPRIRAHVATAWWDLRTDLRGDRPRAGGYRPALDTLRAVAVIAVLLLHERVSWLKGGGHGVDLFFALSGFLITTLLLRERQRRDGAIDVGRFYGRRLLRLAPALALLLLVVLPIALSGHEDTVNVLATATYSANWVSALSTHSLGMLAHTWSLAVEEQFYLVWPCVVILSARRFGARGVFVAAVSGAVLSLVVRIVLARHGSSPDRLLHGTDTTADQLLWGCALAAAATLWPERVRQLVRLAFVPAVAFLVVVFVRDLPYTHAGYTFGYALVALAGAAVVGRLGLGEDRLTRALAPAKVVWIGTISYGIYLWHYPIEYELPGAIADHGKAVSVAAALVLSIAAATASFYLVERPLARRFHARLMPGAAPAAAPVSEPEQTTSPAGAELVGAAVVSRSAS
jgi:peptidoglycan/LPS O-acetylase OafA/YrhL